MADNSMTFSDTLMQLGGENFLRELTEFMLNRIMEADVIRRINAEPHERSDERETYRNGYRNRNVVERCFGRLKEYRRIATRYDKTARNYLAMVKLGCIRQFYRTLCN
ncbi:transposase [Salmonella enterica subsp. enterica serovar Panama]|uniref:Transposase n=1 Tax=Salmonella enterica subsp. enterica serovar Panama TaxID=29472 RepID=A0A751YZZ7_SALET|nr:hypothetical protein [Salmonella enterica subsp. enterica serovar Sandiego]EBR3742714.1 transposase [Salmonella enterica]EGS7285561.1 transposase [Salmonella enterica subsp. enterica serovar Panama]EGS7544113.1 transposase [Salmonella enterica subsp. enterica serovar Panama]EHC9769149.1 transposase [Salmonella enterica subsp. enterica serovar Panama]